ncbi:hypothetical protein [Methylobacterium oryzae]|uniref:hypothetical protein n=1 Tax=Methylobacterium oryzae TaxID=334852 RepID=UPI002F3525BC
MATMPPSPRLSARRISTAYFSDTIRISDHRISETAPVAAAGTAAPPAVAAFTASLNA